MNGISLPDNLSDLGPKSASTAAARRTGGDFASQFLALIFEAEPTGKHGSTKPQITDGRDPNPIRPAAGSGLTDSRTGIGVAVPGVPDRSQEQTGEASDETALRRGLGLLNGRDGAVAAPPLASDAETPLPRTLDSAPTRRSAPAAADSAETSGDKADAPRFNNVAVAPFSHQAEPSPAHLVGSGSLLLHSMTSPVPAAAVPTGKATPGSPAVQVRPVDDYGFALPGAGKPVQREVPTPPSAQIGAIPSNNPLPQQSAVSAAAQPISAKLPVPTAVPANPTDPSSLDASLKNVRSDRSAVPGAVLSVQGGHPPANSASHLVPGQAAASQAHESSRWARPNPASDKVHPSSLNRVNATESAPAQSSLEVRTSTGPITNPASINPQTAQPVTETDRTPVAPAATWSTSAKDASPLIGPDAARHRPVEVQGVHQPNLTTQGRESTPAAAIPARSADVGLTGEQLRAAALNRANGSQWTQAPARSGPDASRLRPVEVQGGYQPNPLTHSPATAAASARHQSAIAQQVNPTAAELRIPTTATVRSTRADSTAQTQQAMKPQLGMEQAAVANPNSELQPTRSGSANHVAPRPVSGADDLSQATSGAKSVDLAVSRSPETGAAPINGRPERAPEPDIRIRGRAMDVLSNPSPGSQQTRTTGASVTPEARPSFGSGIPENAIRSESRIPSPQVFGTAEPVESSIQSAIPTPARVNQPEEGFRSAWSGAVIRRNAGPASRSEGALDHEPAATREIPRADARVNTLQAQAQPAAVRPGTLSQAPAEAPAPTRQVVPSASEAIRGQRAEVPGKTANPLDPRETVRPAVERKEAEPWTPALAARPAQSQTAGMSGGYTLTTDRTAGASKPVFASEPAAGSSQMLFDQLVERFRLEQLPGSVRFTVQLRPENLGRVHIETVQDGEVLTAIIRAEDARTRVALETGLEGLLDRLEEVGIHVDRAEVTDFQSGNSSEGGHRGAGAENRNRRPLHQKEAEVPDSPDEAGEEREDHDGTLSYFA